MKSLVLVAPNELRIQERPIPQPSVNEVLLRVAYTAICHTDIYTVAGGFVGMPYPTVLGHEFSAVVETCGVGVTHVKPGDRVTAMGIAWCGFCDACRTGVGCENLKAMPRDMEGPFQEFVRIPAMAVFPIPDSMSLEHAALAEPASCAFNAAGLARIQPGERVVILGVGPIGLLALQCAALHQPSALIAVDNRNRNRVELAAQLGATDTLLVAEADPYTAIMDITNGKGADAVIWCGGGLEAWELAGRLVGYGGRIVVEAMAPRADAAWPVPVAEFGVKLMSYVGAGGFTPAHFRTVLRLMQDKRIDVGSLITHRFPLDKYEEALELAEKHGDIAIKILFDLTPDKAGESSR